MAGHIGLEAARRAAWGIVRDGTVYVSLHTADPTSAGTGELAGSGYARVAVAAAGWTRDAASGEVSNTAAVAFAEPTAAWADATHGGVWDSAAAGVLLAWGPLTDDIDAAEPGVPVRIGSGGLTITVPHTA